MITAGLFDIQINGYAGIDFNHPSLTPQSLDYALEALLKVGVTTCLPTIITADSADLRKRICAVDAAVSSSQLGPLMVPGYHLEGPFLNDGIGYRGCHPAHVMIDPDIAMVMALDMLIKRPILLVTIAPERHGGIEAVKALKRAGKAVAIGHSAANYTVVKAAADAGITLSTHLGNGLPAELPKLENTLLAQLAEPRLTACLIADGHHISRDAIAALIRLKGVDNCILVSDAVLAAGAQAGPYRFADIDIQLDEKGAVTRAGSTGLAGSALSLDQAVRNIVAWGIADPPTAINMAGEHPRASLAEALKCANISITPGTIEWNSALVPKLLTAGEIRL